MLKEAIISFYKDSLQSQMTRKHNMQIKQKSHNEKHHNHNAVIQKSLDLPQKAVQQLTAISMQSQEPSADFKLVNSESKKTSSNMQMSQQIKLKEVETVASTVVEEKRPTNYFPKKTELKKQEGSLLFDRQSRFNKHKSGIWMKYQSDSDDSEQMRHEMAIIIKRQWKEEQKKVQNASGSGECKVQQADFGPSLLDSSPSDEDNPVLIEATPPTSDDDLCPQLQVQDNQQAGDRVRQFVWDDYEVLEVSSQNDSEFESELEEEKKERFADSDQGEGEEFQLD